MRRSTDLTRRVYVVGAAVLLLLGLLGGGLMARRVSLLLTQEQDRALVALATQVGSLVEQHIAERRREARQLAYMPTLIEQARAAAAVVPQPGQRFLGSPKSRVELSVLASRSGFGDVGFTDRRGLMVASPSLADTLDQSGSAWWRVAHDSGEYLGVPEVDPMRGLAVLDFATAMTSPGETEPVGVLRARLPLERLGFVVERFVTGAGRSVRIVDQNGIVVYSSRSAQDVAKPPVDAAVLTRLGSGTVGKDSGDRVAVVRLDEPSWTVVARAPRRNWLALLVGVDRGWVADAFVFLVIAGLILWTIVHLLQRQIIRPLHAVEDLTTEVAQGNLAVSGLTQRGMAREIERLLQSTARMVAALRELVEAIRQASAHATGIAGQIAQVSGAMNVQTNEVGISIAEVNARAERQAALVRAASGDAARIQAIAQQVAGEAVEAADRNGALTALAENEQARLDRSVAELIRLADEIQQATDDADALAAASRQIEQFVAHTKQIADQSHLLSLNASIEAARAGVHGRGFTVVAEEVRRLALTTGNAAENTSRTVASVQHRVALARERLLRLAAGGSIAREAALTASRGMASVATEAAASDGWSRRIAASSAEVQQLIGGIVDRMGEIGLATEEYAATGQQLTGASHHLEDLARDAATSAAELTKAAERLTTAVQSFRLDVAERQP